MVQFSILAVGFAHSLALVSCLPAEPERRAVVLEIPARPTTTFEHIALTSQTASTTLSPTSGVRHDHAFYINTFVCFIIC